MAEQAAPGWRVFLARLWYIWGLSWCQWGLQLADKGCFRRGVRAFTRALRVWPGFAEAFYRRGLIRSRELSEQREGIADLTRALALEPEWGAPLLQRGLLLRFSGDSRAALADLRRFLELEPGSSWAAEARRQVALIEAELAE